jgi:hypothetical protein
MRPKPLSYKAGSSCARLEGVWTKVGGLEVVVTGLAGEDKTSPELVGPAACEVNPGEMAAP